MINLIIFDCDGVLVDSEIIANRIDVETFKQFGYLTSVEECIKRFSGIDVKNTRRIIREESAVDIPYEIFEDIQEKILTTFSDELLPLMTDVLIEVTRQNIPRCVASSSQKERVSYSLELTGQLQFFEQNHIFTSQQVTHGKPAPDLFLFAAKQMNCLPENCLVIEDSPPGIEAAKAAGMHVIGFTGGSHAHFSWYQDRLRKYNIPLAKNSAEVLSFIKTLSLQ